jgi:hypothetical protein
MGWQSVWRPFGPRPEARAPVQEAAPEVDLPHPHHRAEREAITEATQTAIDTQRAVTI